MKLSTDNNLKVLTFLYHEVVNSPEDSGFQRKSAIPYKHGLEEFMENLKIITENSENIITANQLANYSNTKVTILTFDDGGKSAMHVAELLDKQNLKGHFFITTSLIGDKFFLNENEIVDLHNRGHIIGSHSHTHPNVFMSQTYEQMLNEWTTSKNILEKLLGVPVDSCSIPGGDVNEDTYKSAIECGYKLIFDSDPSLQPKFRNDATILGRVGPKTGTAYSEIVKLSNFKGIKKIRIVRMLKKIIKIIIFPVYSKIHNSRKHEN